MNALRCLALGVTLLAACASLDRVEDHGARSLKGRLGGRLIAEFDAGRSTHSHDVPSGVLTADVLRVTNDHRQRLVLAVVEFNNRSDDALHIAVADVRLLLGTRRYGAKLILDLEMPPLRPRTRQTVEFTFEVDTPPPAAVYTMHIAKVFPFGGEFPLRVPVPGLREQDAR
jgi:hypothetical protein